VAEALRANIDWLSAWVVPHQSFFWGPIFKKILGKILSFA